MSSETRTTRPSNFVWYEFHTFDAGKAEAFYRGVLGWGAHDAGVPEFYLTVFKNSRRLDELPATEGGSAPKGRILTIGFELDGQKFTALNGGPMFKFTEAVSFFVRCDSQQEVDDYWSKLSAGGSEGQCGWLKDKFGLSWQIVPARLPDLIRRPKAMKAMLGMKKLDIAELERAAAEE